MKLSLSLILALLLIGCRTYTTIKDDNTNTNVNKTINGDKFEDYKPWWATNDSQTNAGAQAPSEAR